MKKKLNVFAALLLALVMLLPTNYVIAQDLSGSTTVFLGDSITENFEEEGSSYPDLVGQSLVMETINLGLGGTSMSTHPNEYFDAFSFISLSEAIVNQDFSAQEAALDNEDIPDYFADKLDELKAIDWNSVQYVSVLYGANDWGKPIENEDDLRDTNTFKGGGRVGVENLLTAYPHLQFVFITPPYRYWPDFNNVDSDTSENNNGNKPSDYGQAVIDLANEYNFPAINTLDNLGINAFNRDAFFLPADGTHFNQEGTNKLAQFISSSFDFYY